jgi:hypothetical protein
VPERAENTRVKRLLDEIYMVDPCLGSRRLVTVNEAANRRDKVNRFLNEAGRSFLQLRSAT